MKASSLIRFAIREDGIFSAAYQAAYGKPAAEAAGHAAALRDTAADLADDLDAAGVEVHQDGLLAALDAAERQDDYGRAAPAVAARKTTCRFLADLVRRAVSARGAKSFGIPAAALQGAAVARVRADAALRRYAEAAAAHAAAEKRLADLPDVGQGAEQRPQVEADRAQAEASAGRAAAMLTTAIAEAAAAQRAALRVPTVGRVITSAADATPEAILVGVEVPPTHPDYWKCHVVLDPQHAGGVRGFGAPISSEPHCAASAALELNIHGWRSRRPPFVEYLVPRPDLDSLAAVAILSGRVFDGPALAARLEDLTAADEPTPRPGAWRPEPNPGAVWPERPIAVGEHHSLAPINAICLAGFGLPIRDVPDLPMEERLEILVEWLRLDPGTADDFDTAVVALPPAYRQAADAVDAAREELVKAARQALRLERGAAVMYPLDGSGGSSVGYAVSPVVIMGTESFRFRGRDGSAGPTGRKWTVMVHPHAPAGAREAVASAIASLGDRERGWGGNPRAGIWGSPMAGPSRLTVEDVVETVGGTLALRGILGSVPARARGGLPRLA